MSRHDRLMETLIHFWVLREESLPHGAEHQGENNESPSDLNLPMGNQH